VRVVAHHLEVRQGEHVLDLLGRQPRLGGLAVLQAQPLGEAQQRLPGAAVAVDEHAGARVRDRVQPLEQGLHVGQVSHHVDQQHDVEGAAGPRQHRGIARVTLEELQRAAAVPLARSADRGRREVDADALRRFEGREQVARAAAQVEHAQPGGHPHPQDARQVVVVVAVAPPRACDALGVALVEMPDLVPDRVRAALGLHAFAHRRRDVNTAARERKPARRGRPAQAGCRRRPRTRSGAVTRSVRHSARRPLPHRCHVRTYGRLPVVRRLHQEHGNQFRKSKKGQQHK
jgi:hypothetical protein